VSIGSPFGLGFGNIQRQGERSWTPFGRMDNSPGRVRRRVRRRVSDWIEFNADVVCVFGVKRADLNEIE
jgi:hypothetical protein